jgi:ribonuclease-3
LQKLGLAEHIRLGRGEKISEGKSKLSILSDVFEAIIGAIFLDGGIEAAREFLISHFQEDMELVLGSPSHNYKAELQDFFQKKIQKAPTYKVLEEVGPDHAKIFLVGVFLEEQEIGRGEGDSKKQAEQRAAKVALTKLRGCGES